MCGNRLSGSAVLLSGMFFLVFNVLGCATSSRVKDLEMQNQRALETAEAALKEAKEARAMVDELSRYKADAEASAVEAENAAARAEKAAADAMESADRAEEIEKNCQQLYNRILSK